MLRFSDGVTIDTSGPLRKLVLRDGIYLVGEGYLIPVKDEAEYQQIFDKLNGTTSS